MTTMPRVRLLARFALLLGGLSLAGPAPHLWALDCPSQTVTVTRPLAGVAPLCGTIRVDVTISPTPMDWMQGPVTYYIYDFTDSLYMQGTCFKTGATTYSALVNTALLPNAYFYIKATTSLFYMSQTCNYSSLPPGQQGTPIQMVNPCSTRSVSRKKLQNAFMRDAVCTGSSTSPLTGNQTFTIPVSSWDYKGATIPFSISYNSVSLRDPGQPETPNFQGLSERNSHWVQPYAQWISLYQDETGATYAIWNRGNSTLAFQRVGSTNTWSSPDPYNSLSGDGAAPPDQPVTCPNVPGAVVKATNSSFTVTDADYTKYTFGMLYWQYASCQALPHYLLTQIKDRWGRIINVTWVNQSVGTGSEPRVTMVKDDTGTGLTLSYPNGDGLLASVLDAQGRTHTLTYTAVPDEEIPVQNKKKLTKVTVLGPGSPNRVQYVWQFAYSVDPTTDAAAYGGTYTGDLVIRKTESDGLITNYRYEPLMDPALFNGANNHARPREEDWDGRVSQISWTDTDPAADDGSTLRTITRTLDSSGSPATLSFPGPAGHPVQVQYGYSGTSDVTSVTDVSTNRRWNYSYDSLHNLKTVQSPIEIPLGQPLVLYDYTLSAGKITQVIEQVLQDSGTSVGDPVTTLFNSLNFPTQVTATARTGSNHPDQVTQFHYDNDAPIMDTSPGCNLSKFWPDFSRYSGRNMVV